MEKLLTDLIQLHQKVRQNCRAFCKEATLVKKNSKVELLPLLHCTLPEDHEGKHFIQWSKNIEIEFLEKLYTERSLNRRLLVDYSVLESLLEHPETSAYILFEIVEEFQYPYLSSKVREHPNYDLDKLVKEFTDI